MKKTFFAIFTFLTLTFNAFAAVNINTATQAELESLEGIGPVKAQAIIDYRKKNGGFKNIDELEKVDGIGEATLASVRKNVTLSGKTTVAPTSEASAKKSEKTSKESKASDSKTDKSGKESKAEKSKSEAKVEKVKEEKTKKEPKGEKEKTDKAEKDSKTKKDSAAKDKKAKKEKSE
jgi:competence protein ComEA